MSFNLEEISWTIQQALKKYETELSLESTGRVVSIGDGIARIYGLEDAMMSELVLFENGTIGMVLNLEHEYTSVIVLGPLTGVQEHQLVKCTGKFALVPVGDALLGRVISPLGQPLDGKGPIETTEFRPLEFQAPNVYQRKPVDEPLQTGIKAIDAMIPIGRGQRELVIGDRKTGKTSLLIDTIIHQKNEKMHCIYVAIGQKSSTLARLIAALEEHDAMKYTTVIAATTTSPAALQFIAPFCGAAIGEYFMYSGRDAVCFYDDLTKHAQAYRQLSLLLHRPPGREAYPGDIFYLHSRLLERAAKLSTPMGGGSLTAIPVIETQLNDLSAYIPTNVISITDGQIFLESDLFYADILPAINVGLSVSRVGGKAQTKAMKKVAQNLRLSLAQYRELARFTQFGSDLDAATQAQLNRGQRMVELLKQGRYATLSMEQQVIVLHVGNQGFLDSLPVSLIRRFEGELLEYIADKASTIAETIGRTKELQPEIATQINKVAEEFLAQFKRKHLPS